MTLIAALFLPFHCTDRASGRVALAIRATCARDRAGQDLGKSLSRYLVDRVEHIDNVRIHRGAIVTALEGDGPFCPTDRKTVHS
jgi:hypothetical protein